MSLSLWPKHWFHRKLGGKQGFLYVISNPSMPGLIKVGMTAKSPAERMKSLYSTSVPTPFEPEYFALCSDRKKSELIAHQALRNWRVSARREFFRLSPEDAIAKIHHAIGDAKVIYSKHRIHRYRSIRLPRWIQFTGIIVALIIP